MARFRQELLYMDDDSREVFADSASSSDSEHDKYEVKAYQKNKGKYQKDYNNSVFLEDSSDVFIETTNSSSFGHASGSSPSTSSTPRFRSRNSSVRSIQTVDCCAPVIERDGICYEDANEKNEDDDEEIDDSSSDSEIIHHHFHKREEYVEGIDEEIVDEGLQLYMMFLRDEIVQSRLPTPDCINPSNGRFPRNIMSLRTLADQFSVSPQRQWVRIQAESVPLETLDFNSFTELLIGLFQEGGVTWERVVVLFFFCTDLSIRALKESLMRTFHRITEWTTTFICDNFSRWVAANGGWSAILHQSICQVSRVVYFGFFCLGIIAFCSFIRNNGAKIN